MQAILLQDITIFAFCPGIRFDARSYFRDAMPAPKVDETQ
jgi:hypothetical protein